MIIAKKSTPQQITQQRKQGKLKHEIISSMKSDTYLQSIIHTLHKHITTFQTIHYDSTRLIRIHITWSDSADACTCGGYLCSPSSCSPPSYVLQCYNKSISLTTRLALKRFQASCYSHHKSQFALGETNWLLRVSECNLTLNPYLVIPMGHHHRHPLTGAMKLRPDHWSATLKVSPRDPKELCTDTDKTLSYSQIIFTMQGYIHYVNL